MSGLVAFAGELFNWWNGVNTIKANLKRDADPLRLGVISAAAINHIAIIDPVQTHSGVVLTAIAARQREKAQAQIDKFKLGSTCKAYGSYADLLEDPNVDAVYIPLPNGLHAEWAIQAMEAGKHVLIEKPITSNADEARAVQETSKRTGKIALEAFHWRFHPAAHVVKDLVQSGKYGNPVSVDTSMKIPGGALPKDDIRFQYALAGGACMDLTYVYSVSQYFAAPDITKCSFAVSSAKARVNATDAKIDDGMEASFIISQPSKPDVNCHVFADLALKPLFGFIPRFWEASPRTIIELEKGRIEFQNFAQPAWGHNITVTDKATGKKEVKKVWQDGPQWGSRGQAWWTTYRYQLEAFVDAIRTKESGHDYDGPWMKLHESVMLMALIDTVYEKSGLPRRGL